MLLLAVLNTAAAVLCSKLKIMTNILVPTDFTPASFQLAQQAVVAFKGNKITMMLFHAFQMPDPFDLLHRCRKMPYHDLLTESFRQSYRQLKELYPQQLQKIHFNCMEGNTAVMFRNFVEANEIDCIIYPEQYQFIPVSKISVDPGPLFKKSGIRLIRELNPGRQNSLVNNPAVAAPAYLASN